MPDEPDRSSQMAGVAMRTLTTRALRRDGADLYQADFGPASRVVGHRLSSEFALELREPLVLV